jgi:hypothetical protein
MTLEERLKDFARANNGSGEIDAIVLACGRLYGEIHTTKCCRHLASIEG